MAAPRYSWEQPEPVAPTAPDPVLQALDALTAALLERPEPAPSPAPVLQPAPTVLVDAPDLSGLAETIGLAVEGAVSRALVGMPAQVKPDFSELVDSIRTMSKRAIQAAASGGGGSTGGPFPLVLANNGAGTTANPLAVTSDVPVLSVGTVLTASGPLVTPSAGKKVRLRWISFLPSSDNTAANLVTLSFTTSVITAYTGYAISHGQTFTGQTDEPLSVTLANSQPVAFTAHYQEV